MICYKDMTFCPFYVDCKNKDVCHRPLTEKVENDARTLSLPIAMFTSRPECHNQITPNENGKRNC